MLVIITVIGFSESLTIKIYPKIPKISDLFHKIIQTN